MFKKSQQLKKTVIESKEIIQSTVGMDEHYDSFVKSIALTNPDEIKLKLEELVRHLEEIKADRDQKKEDIGDLRSKIEQLASNADLLVKQNEVEMKKQQIRDYSDDWVMSQIALFALEKAISKYETTRQPEVIKAAKNIFANITNQVYSTVIQSAETNELRIIDNTGKAKTVGEMSRGTKEQLYFAMRLGLIKVYETEKEPMPIIMDDILVNFDDERGPLAIHELADYSVGRQVIILTCHKNNLDLYKMLGAKEIILS